MITIFHNFLIQKIIIFFKLFWAGSGIFVEFLRWNNLCKFTIWQQGGLDAWWPNFKLTSAFLSKTLKEEIGSKSAKMCKYHERKLVTLLYDSTHLTEVPKNYFGLLTIFLWHGGIAVTEALKILAFNRNKFSQKIGIRSQKLRLREHQGRVELCEFYILRVNHWGFCTWLEVKLGIWLGNCITKKKMPQR